MTPIVLVSLLALAAPPATPAPVPSPAPATKGPADPIAVMPFRNLNSDPSLEWMRLGVAETMIVDLRKQAKLRVVEREQIDKAIGELALGEAGIAEEKSAAKVGKLVGARTIVLGSFQKAQKEVRITARVIEVETGVVGETAKVTGSETAILSLQDDLVRALLGLPPPVRPKKAAAPKAPEKTVEAYRLYAQALSTATDADRVVLLKKALDVDPDFEYAADDLAQVEKRLALLKAQSDTRTEQRIEALKKKIETGSGMQRVFDAQTLAGLLMQSGRYRTFIREAQRLLELPVPPGDEANTVALHELLSGYVVTSYSMLRDRDAVIQSGEKFLERFPASTQYQSVELSVRTAIEEKRQMADSTAADAEIAASDEGTRKSIAERRAALAKWRRDAENGLRRCDADDARIDEGIETEALWRSLRLREATYDLCEKLAMLGDDRAPGVCDAVLPHPFDEGDRSFVAGPWRVPVAQVQKVRYLHTRGRHPEAVALKKELDKKYAGVDRYERETRGLDARPTEAGPPDPHYDATRAQRAPFYLDLFEKAKAELDESERDAAERRRKSREEVEAKRKKHRAALAEVDALEVSDPFIRLMESTDAQVRCGTYTAHKLYRRAVIECSALLTKFEGDTSIHPITVETASSMLIEALAAQGDFRGARGAIARHIERHPQSAQQWRARLSSWPTE